MNLEKLFETQKVLRDRINYNEPDRFNKLVLALLVELGECANEWRGFKFWSKDQTPRTKKVRKPYVNLEDAEFYNPLLEEYVDGLHFVLEIGLDLKFSEYTIYAKYKMNTVEEQFIEIHSDACNLKNAIDSDCTNEEIFAEYRNLWMGFIGLGEMLGFTWEQIEQAYYEKNKENHARQDRGY